jgi:hypothetical protein
MGLRSGCRRTEALLHVIPAQAGTYYYEEAERRGGRNNGGSLVPLAFARTWYSGSLLRRDTGAQIAPNELVDRRSYGCIEPQIAFC